MQITVHFLSFAVSCFLVCIQASSGTDLETNCIIVQEDGKTVITSILPSSSNTFYSNPLYFDGDKKKVESFKMEESTIIGVIESGTNHKFIVQTNDSLCYVSMNSQGLFDSKTKNQILSKVDNTSVHLGANYLITVDKDEKIILKHCFQDTKFSLESKVETLQWKMTGFDNRTIIKTYMLSSQVIMTMCKENNDKEPPKYTVIQIELLPNHEIKVIDLYKDLEDPDFFDANHGHYVLYIPGTRKLDHTHRYTFPSIKFDGKEGSRSLFNLMLLGNFEVYKVSLFQDLNEKLYIRFDYHKSNIEEQKGELKLKTITNDNVKQSEFKLLRTNDFIFEDSFMLNLVLYTVFSQGSTIYNPATRYAHFSTDSQLIKKDVVYDTQRHHVFTQSLPTSFQLPRQVIYPNCSLFRFSASLFKVNEFTPVFLRDVIVVGGKWRMETNTHTLESNVKWIGIHDMETGLLKHDMKLNVFDLVAICHGGTGEIIHYDNKSKTITLKDTSKELSVNVPILARMFYCNGMVIAMSFCDYKLYFYHITEDEGEKVLKQMPTDTFAEVLIPTFDWHFITRYLIWMDLKGNLCLLDLSTGKTEEHVVDPSFDVDEQDWIPRARKRVSSCQLMDCSYSVHQEMVYLKLSDGKFMFLDVSEPEKRADDDIWEVPPINEDYRKTVLIVSELEISQLLNINGNILLSVIGDGDSVFMLLREQGTIVEMEHKIFKSKLFSPEADSLSDCKTLARLLPKSDTRFIFYAKIHPFICGNDETKRLHVVLYLCSDKALFESRSLHSTNNAFFDVLEFFIELS